MIIYKITNLTNNKMYIGQTTQSLKERMRCHLKDYKNNLPIDVDLHKLGIENFKIEQIDEAKTKNELDEKEIYYIKLYNTKYPIGYNLSDGGSTTKGYHHRQESKDKMRNAKRKCGKKISEAYMGEGNPFYGKKHSEESKQKMSEKRKGFKHLTEEQIANLKKSHFKTKVMCIETNEIFNSIREAEKIYNIKGTHISRVCRGKRKTTGGYHWKYI